MFNRALIYITLAEKENCEETRRKYYHLALDDLLKAFKIDPEQERYERRINEIRRILVDT